MSESSAVEAAARRLELALDALDAAMERRREADHGGVALVAQLQSLSHDRARLADELDAAAARGRQLEVGNHEAIQRIDAAMATIRSVIETPET